MIKKILTTGILFVILATLVAPVGVGAQLTTQATCEAVIGARWTAPNGPCVLPPGADYLLNNTGLGQGILGGGASAANFLVEGAAQWIGSFLQRTTAFFLIIGGLLFDGIVKYTIQDMSINLGTDTGIGTSIQQAWSTLRDIANMVFIFVLLYTAFNYMFSVGAGNVGRNIAWIVIVALVINFSLFFSKVVIDASNVVSLGFLRAISNAGEYRVVIDGNTQTQTNNSIPVTGISGGYMRMLGVHGFFSPAASAKGASNILLIGILTAVFNLITAVIFLIAGVMFAARFVILIFLMILSPIAFIAYIIPGKGGEFSKWWDALVNQSFFAPVFFGLTWVVFKLGMSPNFLNGVRQSPVPFSDIISSPSSALGLIINYVIVIGFSIFALSAAKGMTKSVSQFASITTGIGAVTVGGAAFLGRNIAGRGAKYIADNNREALSKTWYGRTGLWAANKTAGASFDARTIGGTGVGKALGLDKGMEVLGKSGGKGGFQKIVSDKVDAKAKYAKDVYGQTDFEKDQAKKLKDEYEAEKLAEENRIKREREAEAERRLTAAKTTEEKLEASRYEREINYKNKNKIFKDEDYSEEFIKGIKSDYERFAKAGERRQEAFAKRLENKRSFGEGAATGAVIGSIAGPIGTAVGAAVGTAIGGFIKNTQGNKAAARKIIEQAKGPSKEKKLADAYKDIAGDDAKDDKPASTPADTGASTGGTPPPPTS